MDRNKFHVDVNVSRGIHFLIAALIWLCSPVTHAGGISVASSCNPVAQDACGLPFPSDLFRNLTGTYNFSNSILDRTVNGPTHQWLPVSALYPAGFQPARIFNNSNGFSALGPVLFELNEFPLQDIPKDGAGTLMVIDMDTDEQVPMVVSLSKVANPTHDFRASRPVIIAWPQSRFQYGKKYVAVLLKAPFDEAVGNTTTYVPSTGMQKVLDNKAAYFVQLAYKPALAVVDRNGIERSNILAMTYFTVRTEDEVTSPLKKMVQEALTYPSIVTNLQPRTTLGDSDYELVTLTGQLSLVNFRGSDGGIYPPYDPVPDPDRRKTDFVLTLPKWDSSTPIPISIWGHGLGNAKEVTKSGFKMGDRLGMATIAIDHPNHGSRINVVGNKEPYIAVAVQSPTEIMQLLGMFVQAVVDQCVVAKHAHDALPLAVSKWHDADYPNVPNLDGSRVIFDGMSLGAMVGTAIGAVAPDLAGAYLVNGAGSLMQIFTESTFWDDMTSHVIPESANGAELTFIVAMMQQYVDIADGNNFMQYYRNPPPGQDVRPLGMHYSLGDGSVPNDATRASAILADLPLLKEVIQPEPLLRDGDVGLDTFEDGYGLVQSGYGLEEANQVIDQIKLFDPNRFPGLDQSSLLTQLAGVNLGNSALNDSLQQAVASLNAGATGSTSFSDLVDTIYQGNIEDFMTHFNRGSVQAVQHSIDWRCDVLQLDQSRCDMAKAKVVEDQKDLQNTDPTSILGGGSDPLNQIDDLIQQGISKVQVTEGSAGAFDALFLLAATLLLIRLFLVRKLQPKPIVARTSRH